MTSIGNRITEACEVARLSIPGTSAQTIVGLAAITGIPADAVEQGRVTIQQVDQIAHTTGTDYVWLLGGCG